MAQFDNPTIDFMKSLGKDNPALDDNRDIIRASIRMVRRASSPKAILPRMGITQFAGRVWNEEKISSVSVLGIYKQMNELYKRDWWDWEPETIWASLVDDGYDDITEELKNAVLALQTILNTNQAHENWHIFENVGQAFNFNTVSFSIIQPLELDEISLTLKILNTIRPKQIFESEIDGYVAACAKSSGVVYLPSDLFPTEIEKPGDTKTAQNFLDELNNDLELKDAVAKRWAIDQVPRKNDPLPLKVQLLRLKEIEEYSANA